MDFRIDETNVGKGVFTLRPFATGELLFPFEGEIIAAKDMPVPYDAVADHYMQIGKDLYLGPHPGKETVTLDDYTNHSCNPNSGLHIGERVLLVAIRAISAGEEITWDYSTTMAEDDWELNCACGSVNCRGRVRDFKHLPEDVQRRYAALGIVSSYVLESSPFFRP
jgi:SET domain-containing protein